MLLRLLFAAIAPAHSLIQLPPFLSSGAILQTWRGYHVATHLYGQAAPGELVTVEASTPSTCSGKVPSFSALADASGFFQLAYNWPPGPTCWDDFNLTFSGPATPTPILLVGVRWGDVVVCLGDDSAALPFSQSENAQTWLGSKGVAKELTYARVFTMGGGGGWLSATDPQATAPFSALCLLAFQNAVNMADGRDGLVAGITLIWLAALFSYGPHPSNFPILALFAGLLIVFFANLRGLLFLGDAGTYGIGAFVGLTTIWIHGSNIGLYTIDVITIMLIPILDMIRLFGMRLIRGMHPFSADHDHLHHHLDRAVGWLWGRRIYFGLVCLPIALLRTEMVAGGEASIIGSILYIAALAFASAKGANVRV